MGTITKRTNKSGDVYRAEVMVHGRRESGTFDTKKEAQIWSARLETEMRGGKYLDTASAKNITLAQLLERFGDEITPTRRTARSAHVELGKIRCLMLHPIAQSPILTVTSGDVARYVLERKKTAAPATISRDFSLFRRVVNIAIKRWDMPLHKNVFAGAELPPIHNARDRILSPDEITALKKALSQCENPMMLVAFKIAIETGLRKAELLGLEWADIDLKLRTLHVRRVSDLKNTTVDGTKNGESSKIPLTLAAVAVFKALRHDGDKVLAGLTYNALTLAWKRAKARSGVVDVRWHDLRHAAITAVAGKVRGDIFKLKLFSRHKSTVMLARYVNLKPADLFADLDS